MASSVRRRRVSECLADDYYVHYASGFQLCIQFWFGRYVPRYCYIFVHTELRAGIAGAFGATIVYPIDLGK